MHQFWKRLVIDFTRFYATPKMVEVALNFLILRFILNLFFLGNKVAVFVEVVEVCSL